MDHLSLRSCSSRAAARRLRGRRLGRRSVAVGGGPPAFAIPPREVASLAPAPPRRRVAPPDRVLPGARSRATSRARASRASRTRCEIVIGRARCRAARRTCRSDRRTDIPVSASTASSTTITAASAFGTGRPARIDHARARAASVSPGATFAALGTTLTASVRCFGGHRQIDRARPRTPGASAASDPDRRDRRAAPRCRRDRPGRYMFGTIASAIGTVITFVGPSIVDALDLDDAAAPPRDDALGRIERRLDEQLGRVARRVLLLVGDQLDDLLLRDLARRRRSPPVTQNVSLVWFGRPWRPRSSRHLVLAAMRRRERARHRLLRRGHRAGLRIDLLGRVLALLVLPGRAAPP